MAKDKAKAMSSPKLWVPGDLMASSAYVPTVSPIPWWQ